MTHFKFQGTGETTGGGGPPLELAVLALVLVAGSGAVVGIAEAVAQLIMYLLAAVGVIVLAAVVGFAYLVRRSRSGRPLLSVPLVRFHQLGPWSGQQSFIAPRQAKALPQVTNNFYGGHHVHGADERDSVPVVRAAIVPSEDGEP